MKKKRLCVQTMVGLLVVLWVLVLGFLVIRINPDYFLIDDSATFFFPNFVFNYHSLVEEGKLPLINPYQLMGNRHLAQGQTAVLYVPVYVSVWLAEAVFGGVSWATSVFVMIHLMVAGVGMSLLVWSQKKSWIENVLLVVWWSSLPFVMGVVRSWLVVAVLFCFLPFDLFFLNRLLQKKGEFGSWFGLMVAKLGLVFFGYVPWVVMVVFAEVLMITGWFFRSRTGVRGLVRGWVDNWRFSVKYWLSLVWVGGVGAPVLMPLWDASKKSVFRTGTLPFMEFINLHVDLVDFIKAQLGWFTDDVISKTGSQIYFVGVGLFLLLWISIRWKKLTRKEKILCVMVWLFLAFSGLGSVGLYFVPVLNWFRYPVKFFPFFLLFLTWFLSVGMESLGQRKKIVINGFLLVSVGINIWILLTHTGNDEAFSGYGFKQGEIFEVESRVISVNGALNQDVGVNTYLTHNFSSLGNILSVGGYDPVVSKKNYELGERMVVTGSFVGQVLDEDLVRWGGKGVEWLVTKAEYTDLIQSKYAEEVMRKGDVVWYKNSQAFPVAYIEGSRDQLTAGSLKLGVNSFEVSWTKGQVGVLKVLFAAIDGWSYDLGEGYVKVDTKNDFLEVPVEVVHDRVFFEYRDESFEFGIKIMLLTCLLSLGGVWWFRRRKIA